MAVSERDFEAMIAALGPFEPNPLVAAAVSGGGDSMALCLLADRWARRAGGCLVALTVDHGLRPEAAAEARRVGGWLAAYRIEHHILSRPGPRPVTGIQAAARRLRYELMTSWCREAGVLHLLLAHNLEDQAETFLLRLGRGSGIDGLSGMAAVVETPEVRILRPVLGVERRRLRATLAEHRQEWIEDPSNRDPGYTRTGLRAAQPALTGVGLGPARLAAAARRMGEVRGVLEGAVSTLLAGCCAVYPAGYAGLDAAALAAAPGEVASRALGRVLLCIGGRDYAPRPGKLERLRSLIADGGMKKARTLGGCRILPRGEGLLVCREGRGKPAPVAAAAGRRVVWDGRFVIDFAAVPEGGGGTPARLTRLGRDGWAEVVGDRPEIRSGPVPFAAAPPLPALRDDRGVFAVAHLNYRRRGGDSPAVGFARVAFRPPNGVSGTGFFLA